MQTVIVAFVPGHADALRGVMGVPPNTTLPVRSSITE